jgi:hypothetical protein
MAEPGTIRFSGTRLQQLDGNYNPQTGQISDLRLLDARQLNIQGNLSEGELQRFQTQLRNTEGADTSATRERIADRADNTNQTQRTPPPAEYTRSGRYTEARTDADLREGFRGDRVRTEQQRLFDQGYLKPAENGKNPVDGFWGPQTQAAYERFQADQRAIRPNDSTTTRTNNPDTTTTTNGDRTTQTNTPDSVQRLRTEAGNRTGYQPVTNPDETSRELVQDIRAGNTDDVTNRLTNSTNADLRQIDQRLPRNADGTYATEFPDVAGNDSDYADFTQRMLRGNRNEGADASAASRQVDDFQDQILRSRVSPFSRGIGATSNIENAWNGTDEASINNVFARASGAQLAALDQRIRQGVRDENGDLVKFDNGLRGLIEKEIGPGAHRDALFAQLNRPLN